MVEPFAQLGTGGDIAQPEIDFRFLLAQSCAAIGGLDEDCAFHPAAMDSHRARFSLIICSPRAALSNANDDERHAACYNVPRRKAPSCARRQNVTHTSQTPRSSPAASREAAPQRRLSLVDTTSMIVGIIIGSGLYETTPVIAANVPSAAWLVGGWLRVARCRSWARCATPNWPRHIPPTAATTSISNGPSGARWVYCSPGRTVGDSPRLDRGDGLRLRPLRDPALPARRTFLHRVCRRVRRGHDDH